MDYTEVGGAPLLGVRGAVVKAHGSSNAKAFASALRQADDWLTELSTGKAPQRLARLLLQLSDGDNTVMLFSREDLGSILGITTEHASRTVAEFRRAGHLVEIGANLFRCDRRQLENVASGPA